MHIDEKINRLHPGQAFELSRSNGIVVTVERSGDGKRLRFVRQTKDGFQVFRDVEFSRIEVAADA